MKKSIQKTCTVAEPSNFETLEYVRNNLKQCAGITQYIFKSIRMVCYAQFSCLRVKDPNFYVLCSVHRLCLVSKCICSLCRHKDDLNGERV